MDGIMLEDDGEGFWQQSFIDEIAVLAAGKTGTADPNPRNQLQWRGITAVKPNRTEAFSAANEPWKEPVEDPTKDQALLAIGVTLLKIWGPKQLLITLGDQ